MKRRWESDGLEPVGTRDHARGPMDAPVTLVKYGDYECPYCGEAHPVLKELQGLLYERQDELGEEDLMRYAAELGLDLRRFVEDLTNDNHAWRIEEDRLGGHRAGARGTATLLGNGVRHKCP